MPARGPAGDDDRPLDAVLASLGVEPVERAFQLVGDLRQARLRRQRVAAQSRRPTTSQRTLGEAGKDLLAAALPIAAVNVRSMAPSDHWQDIGPTYCVPRFHKPSRDASGAARAASSKLRPNLRFSCARSRGLRARHCYMRGCGPQATL